MSDPNTDPVTPTWKQKSIWLRGLWMLLIGVLVWAAQVILQVMTLIQFIIMLVDKGKPNAQIADLGKRLGAWLQKAALFQTGQSEDRPWPWAALD
jgi:hypothetical protein